MATELTLTKSGSIMPQNFSEMMQFADMLSKSAMVPDCYKNKPGDIIIAIQLGNDVGLKALQALQTIAPINGKPAIYGDGAIGLVRASGLLESFEEIPIMENNNCIGYHCKAKRKKTSGTIEHKFTINDAKEAKLWGKSGPWTNYPKRMLQMRARSWVLRDGFADVLKGLAIVEEAIDIEPIQQPDKTIISIDDLKPIQENISVEDIPKEGKTGQEKIDMTKEIFNASEITNKKDSIAIEELKGRISKAIMLLTDNDIKMARQQYHEFADIINPIEEKNENGEKYIKMEKIIAKDLKDIPFSQAKAVWDKIEEHFKRNGRNVKEELKLD